MNNIQIDVKTLYIEEQSKPDQNYYVFSYTITISNKGDQPVKLLNRHWIITDSNQRIQEVRGEGVIGEQPYLKPGGGHRRLILPLYRGPPGCRILL